jgi:hypothetical protein
MRERVTQSSVLAAIAAISMAVLGTTAIAQVPSYELEGLINGDEKPRVWYSARGHLEADTGNSGAAMHSFRVYGDWDSIRSLGLRI